MTLLLVDVGNSRTVAATAVAMPAGTVVGPIAEVFAAATPTGGDGAAALAAELLSLAPDDATVGVTSVVPAVTAALRAAHPDVRAVDHTWRFPFTVSVTGPETVGADRWCNVAAAVGENLADAIVVDAGTATTIDVLDAGAFVGGLIAPGMAFAARKLQESGARLWTVPFASCPLAPGHDTATALQAGAYHVGRQGVLGVVRELAGRYPRAQVVVTGGLGGHLEQVGWRHDPRWTLRGLARLLAG